MSRVDARVTSVQVVQGFPASLTIPNPPGWERVPPFRSTSTSSPELRVGHGLRHSAQSVEEDTHVVTPTSTPVSVRQPAVPLLPVRATELQELVPTDGEIGGPPSTPSEDSMDGERITNSSPNKCTSGGTHTPNRCDIPVGGQCVQPDINPDTRNRLHTLKVSGENVFVNYTIRRGNWLEEPPAFLDFSSCKNGPIIYVNDVTDKKVAQIWKWDITLSQWISVGEGDIFQTGRARRLELDRNQVPRLRAVRRPRGAFASGKPA